MKLEIYEVETENEIYDVEASSEEEARNLVLNNTKKIPLKMLGDKPEVKPSTLNDEDIKRIVQIVKSEIGRIPKQEPVEKIIQKTEVVREIEKKDGKKYVEESAYLDLLVKLAKMEKQLKETKRMAESPIVLGGSGVIGIPPPEPATVGQVLTVNTNKKAEWKTATGGSGGLTAGSYTVSNPTDLRTFDANDTSLDELADVVATLIQDLGGL